MALNFRAEGMGLRAEDSQRPAQVNYKSNPHLALSKYSSSRDIGNLKAKSDALAVALSSQTGKEVVVIRPSSKAGRYTYSGSDKRPDTTGLNPQRLAEEKEVTKTDLHFCVPVRGERGAFQRDQVLSRADMALLNIETSQDNPPSFVLIPGERIEVQLLDGSKIKIKQEESRGGTLGKFVFEDNGKTYKADSLQDIKMHL